MIGGDLTAMDSWTKALLTNAEVIGMNQHSTGNRSAIVTDKLVVWVAESTEGKGTYIAIFNRGDDFADFHFAWKEMGLTGGQYSLRDLWQHADVGKADGLTAKLQPHACLLYRAAKVD